MDLNYRIGGRVMKMTNGNNIYWKTKDGRIINVDDMDETHVRNAFKMLLRKLNQKQYNNSIEKRFREEEVAEYMDATEIDIY